MKYSWSFLMIALMMTGCSSPSPMELKPRLLSGPLAFLQDGKTTREEIFLKLGQPSAQFEGDRILTYKLNYNPDKGLSIHSWNWSPLGRGGPVSCAYSLVLIFTPSGILEKHNAVPLQQK